MYLVKRMINTSEFIPLSNNSHDLSKEEVARRFRWAKQQGRPAWLWPDISLEAWREAMGQTEAVVRSALSDRAGFLDGDPAAIGLAGYISGMGPLLGWWRETGRIQASPALAPILDLHLRHSRLRAARMEAAAIDVVEALARRGLEVVVLKGAHTAGTYFPDAGVRPASDVDLLVGVDQAATAEAVLRAEGLVEAGRGLRESSWRPADGPTFPRTLNLVHADDPWSIDLHASLDIFVSAGAPLARLDLADPMASRRRWTPHPHARTLDQPLLLLHLAAHAGSGLQNLTLLRLVELHLVIRRDQAEGALSWNAFLALGERAGLLGFCYPALRLCEDLSPGTVPAFVLEACGRRAPASVSRVVRRLTPSTAQRIDRNSLDEHFMWAEGWTDRLRQLAGDLAPAAGSWSKLWSIYERRAWRLLRGTISR